MRVPDPEGLGRYGRKTMAFFQSLGKFGYISIETCRILDDLKYSCECRDVRGLVLGAKRCMGKLWYTLGIVLIFLFIKLGHIEILSDPSFTNNLRVLTPTKNTHDFFYAPPNIQKSQCKF